MAKKNKAPDLALLVEDEPLDDESEDDFEDDEEMDVDDEDLEDSEEEEMDPEKLELAETVFGDGDTSEKAKALVELIKLCNTSSY